MTELRYYNGVSLATIKEVTELKHIFFYLGFVELGKCKCIVHVHRAVINVKHGYDLVIQYVRPQLDTQVYRWRYTGVLHVEYL